jgi:hypothetical protein
MTHNCRQHRDLDATRRADQCEQSRRRICARISADVGGKSIGVQRQLEACCKLGAERGLASRVRSSPWPNASSRISLHDKGEPFNSEVPKADRAGFLLWDVANPDTFTGFSLRELRR